MNRPLILNPAPHRQPSEALVTVNRAIAEIRRGGMVCLTEEGQPAALMLAAEAATDSCLQRLAEWSDASPRLAMSGRRAEALGLDTEQRVVLVESVGEQLTAPLAARVADPLAPGRPIGGLAVVQDSSPAWAEAAVALVKQARLLPVALVAATTRVPAGLLAVDLRAVLDHARQSALALRRVAEARVPLADAEECRVVAFRPADGGIEHLALVIGQPDREAPVLARLHSECFTGDLLGSLRCDCGDQLKGAIAAIAKAGGGVLLYLAQEGRGIGLVNKLRAYNLQDDGLDTLDANLQLGFDDDERIYLPAAEMLRLLGIAQVRLMTNNPAKVEGLTRHGVAIAERVPHVFPANDHNRRYLSTKAARSGHLF
ncbi:MAG TPA: GTP cyclohydrolase II [Magnetospirillaceae bacterium]|nr:GTP cyclohydrolase II [Magnetospirillaceae bacterium]